MSNPLYDTLFGCHAEKATPFLHLADGHTWTHAQFLELAAQYAHVITDHGLVPGAVSYTHLTLPTILLV